eukprot:TRINITY_DN1722_c0_g1_i1.p1 TRINITY_DN1722_c0_g1~~TRINITY_DN1722_c0_g1_i1.p1  ORF type:complete len:449 (-),score=43.72 TRINITY_DN1722_c0_g1_i1:78-1424(-)
MRSVTEALKIIFRTLQNSSDQRFSAVMFWVLFSQLVAVALAKGAYYGYRGYGGYYYYGGFGYGYYGSSFGGSLRSYRSGAYVPYTRYYVYPMIWTHGPRTKTYSDPSFEDTLLDVMCKRNVTTPLSQRTANSAMFDSRRFCYHEATALPFSEKNTKLTGIISDAYQWTVQLRPTPVISLAAFQNENDLSSPNFNSSVKFRGLSIVDRSQDSQVAWIAFDDLFANGTISYPSGQSQDTTKSIVMTMMSDPLKSPAVIITGKITDDFMEDINQHYFFRPSALQISVQVHGLSAPVSNWGVQLQMDVQSSKAKSASLSHATVGSIYDPKLMDRLDLGTLVDEDITVAQRGYLSWRRSINPVDPCITATEPECVSEKDCGAGSTTCPLLSVKNNTFPWTLQVASAQTDPEFLMYLGYYDVAELTPEELGNGASSIAAKLWIPFIAVLFVVLF